VAPLVEMANVVAERGFADWAIAADWFADGPMGIEKLIPAAAITFPRQ
jgi:hypothetical protein